MSAASTTSGGMSVAGLDPDPLTSRILHHVTDLGNTVLAKRSATELHGIKAKKPIQFQDPDVFRKVMRILERHHFRLPVCRFVIDLFDRKVLRKIVLEEEEEEEEVIEEKEEKPTSPVSTSEKLRLADMPAPLAIKKVTKDDALSDSDDEDDE